MRCLVNKVKIWYSRHMRIVITGASSGIGRALAKAYAAPSVSLGLIGRDEARLAEVAAACRAQGAVVETASLDVRDRSLMASWLTAFDAAAPIDLLIANAGISAGTGGMLGESPEQAQKIFAVNMDGILNTLHPLIPRMIARKAGQIAMMSSLASFRGMPGAPAYSASKGVVRLYGEGLRGDLARHGIKVSVICPGFIRTPMTAVNNFPMPFIMDVDKAALRIIQGLARNQGRIAFPRRLYAFVWLLMALPAWVSDLILGQVPKKG